MSGKDAFYPDSDDFDVLGSDFRKYESIANDNNSRTIDFYREQGFTSPDIQWYATEKVHGTNFSFIADGFRVLYAQRSGIITDSFMGYRDFVGTLPGKIAKLSIHLGEAIQVVTEYYGKGIVNKGAITYRNDMEKAFVAYDIRLMKSNTFLTYPQVMTLFDQFEIPRVAVLGVGTFDELLEFDTRFKSPLAASAGVDTYAEGIVLKPCVDIRLDTGERVVLKRVSEEFAENRPQKVEKKESLPLGEEVGEWIADMNTDIRVGKVAAKFGILPSEKNRFGALIIELANDIAADILTEHGQGVDGNLVKKQITGSVKSFFA